MVFSRYVTVLRNAGKLLRPSVVETRVKPERSFAKTTSIRRACNEPAKARTDFPSSTEDLGGSSVIFNHDVNTDSEQKMLEISSKSTTSFGTSAVDRSATDSFGTKLFVSDDAEAMLEDDAPVPAKGPLDTCDEDLSHVTPNHRPSFNFAAYANNSPVIQELAKLGVELYKLEGNPGKMQFLLQKNFEDMKPYIRFLHDCGVPAESIGAFVTKNPFIFREDMDDLHTRIRYLRAHKFDVEMIARVVSHNPFWLMFSTARIDKRLGFFQQEFALNGSNVRYLATKQPRLITYRERHVEDNIFAVREEMGFNKDETRSLLLAQPKLFMRSRKHIVEVFDYVHNTMKLPHEMICRRSKVLNCRLSRLQMRHKYLEMLGKNQYDPTKPLYISPEAIVTGTDADFCLNVAKTSIATYNLFQKTL